MARLCGNAALIMEGLAYRCANNSVRTHGAYLHSILGLRGIMKAPHCQRVSARSSASK